MACYWSRTQQSLKNTTVNFESYMRHFSKDLQALDWPSLRGRRKVIPVCLLNLSIFPVLLYLSVSFSLSTQEPNTQLDYPISSSVLASSLPDTSILSFSVPQFYEKLFLITFRMHRALNNSKKLQNFWLANKFDTKTNFPTFKMCSYSLPLFSVVQWCTVIFSCSETARLEISISVGESKKKK